MKRIDVEVPEVFLNYIDDWNYEKYFVFGGYGTGKSRQTALKCILKLFKEKRKMLVVRQVYSDLKESCFDLIYEILDSVDLVTMETSKKERIGKVFAKTSPLTFEFPNGSKIIFKGMDRPSKSKSMNGVSIVWIEECSELSVAAYRELLGRVRTPGVSMHFILTTNPVGKDNWTWNEFFERSYEGEDGERKIEVICDEEKVYDKKIVVLPKYNTYYMHSVPYDNPFLPQSFIRRLEDLETYDNDLYRIAIRGRYGVNGKRVLPNFEIAKDAVEFVRTVKSIPRIYHKVGMDFGFETSYNAVVKSAIDDKNKILYVYGEYYKNQKTDPETAAELLDWDSEIKSRIIKADPAEPKTIRFYKLSGFKMLPAIKGQGSRLENTKKMRRFKKIVVSPKCKNVIKELKDLTYKADRNGNLIYDEFNIDPHTFSALWYSLDDYDVADVKKVERNSYSGTRK